MRTIATERRLEDLIECLLDDGCLSRLDLADRLGCAPTQAYDAIELAVARDLVFVVGRRASGRGLCKGPRVYALTERGAACAIFLAEGRVA